MSEALVISREEILNRSENVWPYGNVPYSMDTLHEPDMYRQDCSGYACMCVALPHDYPGSWGGLNTVSMVSTGLWVEIHPSELEPGDFIGVMGEGTGGADGHVMVFVRWATLDDDNDNRCYIREQAGGRKGWQERLINDPRDHGRSWRYTKLGDGTAPEPEPTPPPDGGGAELRRPWPDYMPMNEWFGDYRAGNASHGGHYANERPDVAAIQSRLLDLGYIEVGQADGWFGPKTIAGVSRWQSELYSDVTEFYGQVWDDDWSRLFTY